MEMDLWYDLYLRELVEPHDVAAEYARRARPAQKNPPPPASDDDGVATTTSSWRHGLRHVLRGAA